MENNINFSYEEKETMSGWKGQILRCYFENSDDFFYTTVRLFIGNKAFDLKNPYVEFIHPDGYGEELSRFSCERKDESTPPQTPKGVKFKENAVNEEITDVYIVTDLEKGKYPNSGVSYELEYETALVVQTTNRCYAFWRHLISDSIEIAVCENLQAALTAIKSVEEIQEEAQGDSPYAVSVERRAEKL